LAVTVLMLDTETNKKATRLKSKNSFFMGFLVLELSDKLTSFQNTLPVKRLLKLVNDLLKQ
jgi:hypothetical protein